MEDVVACLEMEREGTQGPDVLSTCTGERLVLVGGSCCLWSSLSNRMWLRWRIDACTSLVVSVTARLKCYHRIDKY
jgi:hypothetical protein